MTQVEKILIVLNCLLFAGCALLLLPRIELPLSIYKKPDGSPFIKIDNPQAQDISSDSLKAFLVDYSSMEHSYIGMPKSCAFAAESLHNSAEAKGIKAAIVIYQDTPTSAHAFNLFRTETGPVYVNVMGGVALIAVEKEGKLQVIKQSATGGKQTQFLGEEKDFIVFW